MGVDSGSLKILVDRTLNKPYAAIKVHFSVSVMKETKNFSFTVPVTENTASAIEEEIVKAMESFAEEDVIELSINQVLVLALDKPLV